MGTTDVAKKCGDSGQLNREGKPCGNWAVTGKKKCRYHGGLSTGPRDPEKLKGNKNALKHGIYSDGLHADELDVWSQIPVDTLDDEIRMVKIRIRRTLIQLKQVEEDPATERGFESSETRSEITTNEPAAKGEGKDGEKGPSSAARVKKAATIKRRPDFRAILDRLIGRLATLMQTKAQMKLAGTDSASKSAEDFAQEIRENLSEMMELSDGGPVPEVDAS